MALHVPQGWTPGKCTAPVMMRGSPCGLKEAGLPQASFSPGGLSLADSTTGPAGAALSSGRRLSRGAMPPRPRALGRERGSEDMRFEVGTLGFPPEQKSEGPRATPKHSVGSSGGSAGAGAGGGQRRTFLCLESRPPAQRPPGKPCDAGT